MTKYFLHNKTQGIYELITTATNEADLTELAVYRNITSGATWVRPINQFAEIDRFSPILNDFDGQYLKIVNIILEKGKAKDDRTGVGTVSITSHTFDIDISERLPVLTLKFTNYETILKELIWFLSGSTNSNKAKVKIWCANTSAKFLADHGLDYKPGYGGPMYGYQWRGKSSIPGDLQWDNTLGAYAETATPGVDQIQYVIDEIKNNPNSRRILISNWDAKNIKNMALPPCHILFQVIVRGDYLDGIMYQRSADLFLGVPFNVASYSTLLYILCNITDKKPGRLVTHFGDIHIYKTHLDKAAMLNDRPIHESPKLVIKEKLDINNIDYSQFELVDYVSNEKIMAEMAV